MAKRYVLEMAILCGFENKMGFTAIRSFSDFLCGKCFKTSLFYMEIRGVAAQIPKTRELKAI